MAAFFFRGGRYKSPWALDVWLIVAARAFGERRCRQCETTHQSGALTSNSAYVSPARGRLVGQPAEPALDRCLLALDRCVAEQILVIAVDRRGSACPRHGSACCRLAGSACRLLQGAAELLQTLLRSQNGYRYVCTCMWMYVCMYVHTCICMCTYVCMCMCMCMYVYADGFDSFIKKSIKQSTN